MGLMPGGHRRHRGDPSGALFKPHLDAAVGCVANVPIQRGEFMSLDGDAADRFFVVRERRVAFEDPYGND
jgi:hypothetical protein